MRPSRRRKGIARARRILDIWRRGSRREDIELYYNEDSPLFKKLIYTRCSCSCQWCGNPRRHYGEKTRQEIIADDIFECQLEDYYNEERYYIEDIWEDYEEVEREMLMLAASSLEDLWRDLDLYEKYDDVPAMQRIDG